MFHNNTLRAGLYQYTRERITQLQRTQQASPDTVTNSNEEQASLEVLLSKFHEHRPDRVELLQDEDKRRENQDKFEGDSITLELTSTFAQLQLTNLLAVNPSKLVELLRIPTCQQQDVQEFNLLLLNRLQRTLHTSIDPTLRNLMSSQFEGKYQHVTVCSNCKSRSVRPTSFLVLDMQIAGQKSISSSLLQDYGHEELLEGSNQYRCEVCNNTKQDAKRFTEFITLPQVLNLQLVRFSFDPYTGQKVKIKDAVLIEETLNLTNILKHSNPAMSKQAATGKIDKKTTKSKKTGSGGKQSTVDTTSMKKNGKEKKVTNRKRGRKQAVEVDREHEQEQEQEQEQVKERKEEVEMEEKSVGPVEKVEEARQVLEELQEEEAIYDLCAVLIHQGLSAYHGHYVCRLKDRLTGLWSVLLS